MNLYKILQLVRQKQPLVQCITNFVTVNDCANILLAAGASPTMAQDIREVEEAVASADALVCNLGAIDFTDSMLLAGKQANKLGIPVILDPVAAGGTSLRRTLSAKLLSEVHFTAIRGNASEIQWLAGYTENKDTVNHNTVTELPKTMSSNYNTESATPNINQNDETTAYTYNQPKGNGVDVSAADIITNENLQKSIHMVQKLARQTETVIAISGALDLISDGERTAVLRNGCATMARITGSGCMLTTLIGAFCGAVPDDSFAATCAAMAVMGICGELAEKRRLANGTGNATFRTDLIDAVFNLNEQDFSKHIQCTFYS